MRLGPWSWFGWATRYPADSGSSPVHTGAKGSVTRKMPAFENGSPTMKSRFMKYARPPFLSGGPVSKELFLPGAIQQIADSGGGRESLPLERRRALTPQDHLLCVDSDSACH